MIGSVSSAAVVESGRRLLVGLDVSVSAAMLLLWAGNVGAAMAEFGARVVG